MITTSRYSSKITRAFAKKLAEEESETYVARGKKTIEALAVMARKSGDARIAVVEEKGGRPSKVSEIAVLETGRWRWGVERACNP